MSIGDGEIQSNDSGQCSTLALLAYFDLIKLVYIIAFESVKECRKSVQHQDMPKAEQLREMSSVTDNIQDDRPIKAEKASKIDVTLEDRELWEQFQSLTNEMIVTKSGRYGYKIVD